MAWTTFRPNVSRRSFERLDVSSQTGGTDVSVSSWYRHPNVSVSSWSRHSEVLVSSRSRDSDVIRLVYNPVPNIVVGGNIVESVDNFVYLGSVFTSDGYCRPDINRHYYRLSVVSNVITPTHLEEPTPFNHHKNAHLPCPGAVRIIIPSWNLVSSFYRFQSPRGLSYEVLKATAANQMALIHPK